MTKQSFIDKQFRPATLATIEQADVIIREYQAQGFSLTLRQLYYQFVARGLIENTQRSYKSLGKTISDARLAGLLDWDAIEDRTRNVQTWIRRRSPSQAIQLARDHYGIDMWKNQETRVEVWIEKEALSGVIDGVCGEYDVPYFACRGYVSQSEQYSAGRRFNYHKRVHGQNTIVLHLGDHDPSGIDMTRDNGDRLDLFARSGNVVKVRRIALEYDQVVEYACPSNPAKMTDSRFESYQAEHGDESWELDALEPSVLVALIREHLDGIIDPDAWAERQAHLDDDLATMDNIIAQLEDM